ncbi:MAG: Hsp70 family protein [Planctomycetaceae bacterium]
MTDSPASPSEGSRYVVGIDLGTTNCAVCYVDTQQSNSHIEHFSIPQLVAAGQVEARATLPSFHYEPADSEQTGDALTLPWTTSDRRYVVGTYAREHGRRVAGRLIESAKSWLCHSGVDRRSAILPWHAADDVEMLSPVQATSRYLQHIREAWDAQFSGHSLAEQDVVLTIPASFDEVARELTVNASRLAGLPKIMLIEEPQAAFYSWVNAHRDDWEDHVSAGQKILICDIGGGTSDFTLINVRPADNQRLQFHRVAVGDHLILGGDNLDLALAHFIERRIAGDGKLEPRQFSILVPTCRHTKEALLADEAPESLTVSVPGFGSKLIGGSLQTNVSRDEVRQLLVEGFLPDVKLSDKPIRRQSGFQEFGLPFASDAAITRYLAAFLQAHQSSDAAESARPDIILFNGGFFASHVLQKRLLDVLSSWFGDHWTPTVLDNDRLDLAVARGAAYFGMVRRGVGIRIVAGLARTYYIGVDREDDTGSATALCLIPAGAEPGDSVTIDHEFELRTGEPVQFPIYVSSTRLTDQASQLVDVDPEQMTALPAIRTTLQTKKKADHNVISARLSARLTEIGTLEVWCHQVDESSRWQLQFDVRSATETDRDAHTGTAERSGIVDQESIDTAAAVIKRVYAADATEKPSALAKDIAASLGQSRGDWPPSLLRSLWATLMVYESGRRRSVAHETRWLNLLGYCLRPGYGMAADDWRVAETWSTVRGKLIHNSPDTVAEWRILSRRIAGGLTAGQQNELASPILALIRQLHRQTTTGKGKAGRYAASNHEAAEIWRMLGSLELLDRKIHLELGQIILDFLPKKKFEPIRPALAWALGRVAARVPVYGPLNGVLPPDIVEGWIERFIDMADTNDSVHQLALMQMSRRTHDRYRDVSDLIRRDVIRELKAGRAAEHLLTLVEEGGTLQSDEATQIIGEALPAGLRVR